MAARTQRYKRPEGMPVGTGEVPASYVSIWVSASSTALPEKR